MVQIKGELKSYFVSTNDGDRAGDRNIKSAFMGTPALAILTSIVDAQIVITKYAESAIPVSC